MMFSAAQVTWPIGHVFLLYETFVDPRTNSYGGCYENMFKLIIVIMCSMNWFLQLFRGIVLRWCLIYEWNCVISTTLVCRAPTLSAWALIEYAKIMLHHLRWIIDLLLASLKFCLLFSIPNCEMHQIHKHAEVDHCPSTKIIVTWVGGEATREHLCLHLGYPTIARCS